MESQNIELKEVREDIKEIKISIKELAIIAQNQALESQRVDSIEKKIVKMDGSIEDIWKHVRKIDMRCLEREPVINYGKKRMENPEMKHDAWFDQFIGSAIRNGIWVALTGIIVPLIMYLIGVVK